MSSTYGLICLKHDPGIEIGDHTIDYNPDTMLATAKNPTGEDWGDHAHCDLVVAAYSYPIVRLACPGKTESGAGCRWHPDARWVEADWLRLLIAAYQAGAAVPDWATEPFSSRCWGRERALRLGPVLGIEKPIERETPSGLPPEPSVGYVLNLPDGGLCWRHGLIDGGASNWSRSDPGARSATDYSWEEVWALKLPKATDA